MGLQLTDSAAIAERLVCGGRVLLLCGEPGPVRQQLAEGICKAVMADAEPCSRINVDLGSPAFGPPAAACRAEHNGTSWQPVDLEGLATLDAARFRLPLVMAAERLRDRSPAGQACLVEAPAVFRGAAATELLPALAQATGAAAALLLTRQQNANALSSAVLRFPLHVVDVGDDCVRLTRSARRAERTALWKAYLSDARELQLQTSRIDLISAAAALKPGQGIGRIVVLRDGDHQTLALGELCANNDEVLIVRTPLAFPDEVRQMLVRDARHTKDEGLVTIPPAQRLEPAGTSRGAYTLRPRAEEVADLGPPPGLHSASTTGVLVSGAFGDPLLHLRLPHQRRSLLIDLGDTVRLPARIAHQVSDLFLSHAHFDHFGGFLWLLRSRIGIEQTCRVFGPPDTAERVEAMVRGITWDLVGDEGPRFEVTELHETEAGVRLQRFIVQAGHCGPKQLDSPAGDSPLLLDEPRLIISATTLDHATPVLAFALQERYRLSLRRDQLRESGLAPGPWLALLHRSALAGNDDTIIELPDGRRRSCGELAAELLQRGPGQKLVYATDFADTPQNRQRVIELARDAHTMFCEASYIEADAKLARQTHHFTARACGEVAAAANVERLVPFHFSRRYEREPEKIYAEVVAAFDRRRVLLPRRIAHAI